ncbi:MAG: hypothetical protein JWN40_3339 [Phycisphaerales bacterium]|nr:hypothetical protein [Phycisphaerales bacterium]
MSTGVEFIHGFGTFLIVAAVIVIYMLIANALGLYWEDANDHPNRAPPVSQRDAHV